MSSVQLNVYRSHDEVTGTLVLTVHDPLAEVSSVGFYVTDGSGTRSTRLAADRTPSPGVYEKDVLLDLNAETLIEPDVALTSGVVLKPGAESFSRNSAEMGRLQVGPGVDAWMHNPYADEVGAPTAHISRLEVGGKKSANGDQPAILRIHQSGSGAAEFFKPKGTTLQLRETPGGNRTWFTHFLVNGASVRATGHIHSDSYFYAHWNSIGRRMRMGEIYGVAGLYTPDSEMKFDIGGTGPFRFTMGGTEKMSVHGNGWMELQGSLWVSKNNATGGGIVLADDGDIADLNDGWASMRFTNGIKVHTARSGGEPVIFLEGRSGCVYVDKTASYPNDIPDGSAHLILRSLADRRKRVNIAYHDGGASPGYGYIAAGFLGVQWTHLALQPGGGNVVIGTTVDNGSTLYVNGTGGFNGTVTATGYLTSSSREKKENISPFTEDALGLVGGVDVVNFTYGEDADRRCRVGFIAEDTDPLFSGAEQKHFDLANAVGVLIRAVQQLTGRMEGLEQRA